MNLHAKLNRCKLTLGTFFHPDHSVGPGFQPVRAHTYPYGLGWLIQVTLTTSRELLSKSYLAAHPAPSVLFIFEQYRDIIQPGKKVVNRKERIYKIDKILECGVDVSGWGMVSSCPLIAKTDRLCKRKKRRKT